jgi:hypothetical protein
VVGCKQPATPSMWMVVGMIVCVIVGCGYGAHDLLRFNSIRYI